jgi:hypothetical protein
VDALALQLLPPGAVALLAWRFPTGSSHFFSARVVVYFRFVHRRLPIGGCFSRPQAFVCVQLDSGKAWIKFF